MPSEFHFSGHAKGGKLISEDPDSFMVWMAMLEGKKIVGTLKKWHKTRTSQQNRAWWGIMIPIYMQCYGTDNKDEAHRALCCAVGHSETHCDIKGRRHEEPKETHNLPTDEFSQLWEKGARHIAIEFGVVVPDPNPELARI